MERVEGKLKVTGAAKYTGDVAVPRMVYGVLLESSIASGRIRAIDTSAAEKYPGVIGVLDHRRAPKLKAPKEDGSGIGSESHLALQSPKILYNGQPIGLVVAATPEQARAAAELVRVQYETAPSFLDLTREDVPFTMPKERFGSPLQGTRGDPAQDFAAAAVTFEADYETPMEYHSPMEPHATLAQWDGDQLTIYETTQYINGVQKNLSALFGIKPEQIKVISRFVGGGFGCKGSIWQPTVITVMAAKVFKRPVRLVLTRQNMFHSVGHRSRTIQHVGLAADKNGKISAIRHKVQSHTSQLQDFIEPSSLLTRILYGTPGLDVSHRLAKLNLPTSTFMRAPGEASGSFALECALDELAMQLNMDPLTLRFVNHADQDPDNGKEWSSKKLKDCYRMGAEHFGWNQRKGPPASMQRNGMLVGYGMATATYPGNRQPASARIRIHRDGSVLSSSATHEIGQGTYTAMTLITAEVMKVPLPKVRFELGSSLLPPAPVAGGSMTAASVGPAIARAAMALQVKLLALAAQNPRSPLQGLTFDKVQVDGGKLVSRADPSKAQRYEDILRDAGLTALEAEASTEMQVRGELKDHCRTDQSTDPSCFSFHSFGAQFAEVEVDPVTMQVRVTRFVGAYDIGRVLNETMARSQGLGGIVMGIGMALMEDAVVDPRSGRIVTRNLADYHVPVHADIQSIDVLFTNVADTRFTEIGSRGVGEIPIVGAAAAVANAVYHATGKRIRQLPITPDKLLV